MENLKVLYIKSNVIKGVCAYKESDYYIDFQPENSERTKSKGSRFYVILDTLTITFIGNGTKEIYSIDAYTNNSIWNQDSTLILPSDYKLGNISLNEIPKDNDRISINISPKFYYNRSRNILSIKFSEEKTLMYIKVSNCLFCGLNHEKLNEIILCDINFI